jgi:(1->4)-alpha-D-glucan 1-alpha-D-glucosylmutase
MAQGGRVWPGAERYDGGIDVTGYSVEGAGDRTGAAELRLSDIFEHMPVAVLKARVKGGLKAARKRIRA